MSPDYTLCIWSILIYYYALQGCLVCELCSHNQQGLLATKDLTLQNAAEAVFSMEAAQKDMKALHGGIQDHEW